MIIVVEDMSRYIDRRQIMIKQAQARAIGLGQEKEKPNDRFEDNDAHFPLIHTDSNPRSQDTRSSTTTSTSFSPSTITGPDDKSHFKNEF